MHRGTHSKNKTKSIFFKEQLTPASFLSGGNPTPPPRSLGSWAREGSSGLRSSDHEETDTASYLLMEILELSAELNEGVKGMYSAIKSP